LKIETIYHMNTLEKVTQRSPTEQFAVVYALLDAPRESDHQRSAGAQDLLAANKRLHHCGGFELIRGKPARSVGCYEMVFKSLCE
jgi:hypothetical protein